MPFVASSWFSSFWKHARLDGVVYPVYELSMGNIIDNKLRSFNIDIVTPTELPEHICGYAVSEGAHLHYAYVKSAYRKLGLAASLCERFKFYTSKVYGPGKAFADKMGFRYDPYRGFHG